MFGGWERLSVETCRRYGKQLFNTEKMLRMVRKEGRGELIPNEDSAGSERCSWAFAMKINQARVVSLPLSPSRSLALIKRERAAGK